MAVRMNPGPGGSGGGGVTSITSSSLTVTGTTTTNIELPNSLKLASVTASPASSVNNYSPTGYVAGTTTRLLLAAASGGSTITGLVAAPDGFRILIVNTSATDPLIFPDNSGSSTSTNQFSNANAATVQIPPGGAAYATYVVNQWMFT